MAPTKRVPCQICTCVESKYTCAKCGVLYCSVPCYKQHRDVCPGPQQKTGSAFERPVLEDAQTTSEGVSTSTAGELQQDPPLRSLASLRWPYVPEESAYPDPLKRDDPKPLQLRQYEAIGECGNPRPRVHTFSLRCSNCTFRPPHPRHISTPPRDPTIN
ncbi:hypothetical protein C8Q80DRAFT_872752 [Daedaleopsis nitida]|nr:hypothetical protein C8Q80DRAFT_872752 [Daedaleopsis nitida]